MRVAFRVLEGDCIALFPHWTYALGRGLCMSYMHVGQHGGASLELLNELPKATPEQYAELLEELVSIGYTELELV